MVEYGRIFGGIYVSDSVVDLFLKLRLDLLLVTLVLLIHPFEVVIIVLVLRPSSSLLLLALLASSPLCEQVSSFLNLLFLCSLIAVGMGKLAVLTFEDH